MNELEKTSSVCPACFQEGKINKIDAKIIEEDGKVWITKNCTEHGSFKEIYCNDVNVYNKWIRFKVTGRNNTDVNTRLFDGQELYSEHTSQSILTNLIITNRCNLRCEYCFMNAGASGFVYEPSLDEIKQLLLLARGKNPNEIKAIQITGGEPTIREDFFVIIRMAKENGFTHIQIHTNGIKLAESIEYCQRLKNEQVNTIYLSFDGVTKKTNPWITQSKKAINNLKKVNLKVVLVPVIRGDKNLKEVGKIIRFALENIDIIKGVNFQPISFCGRAKNITDAKRETQRVDNVNIFAEIEKEFDGHISRDDFYPASIAYPVSQIIDSEKWRSQFELTAHPGCGGVAYIFYEDGKPLPITRFIDVEGLVAFIKKQSDIKGPLKKIRRGASFIKHTFDYVDKEKLPAGMNLKRILTGDAIWGNDDSLAQVQRKILFIGSMWFQDSFNLDVDKLKRCVIHCTTPEGMVPFCTYYGIGFGEKIEEKHSISLKEWEGRVGRSQDEDLWKSGPSE
jgi:hypothetical protein